MILSHLPLLSGHGEPRRFHLLQPIRRGRRTCSSPATTLVLINIHSHVPVKLATDEGNFRQWRSFFELTIKKFGLLSHIDGTVDAAAMTADLEWLQIDACIVSRLYSTVSKDIWNDVYKPGNTAYAAWSAIIGQFLDNSLQRAVYA